MAGHTSAPLNSFSIFRVKNYKDEHIKYAAFHSTDNALIESIKADTQISNRLDVEDANGNIIKYFNMIRKWANSISKEDLAVMHGHQPGSSIIGVLALFFKRSKIPFVYTVHNSFTNFPFFKRIILFLCFFRVDVITFVSQSAYDSFKIHLSQKLLNKSIVIQNGVDMDRVDTALSHIDSQDIKKNSSFRIVCIGRLASQKNLYFLINVMVKLNNNICLDIYGEGLLRDDLQRMINENNLRDRVTLHGNIPRDDLFKYLKKSDLYVSVANYEGLPMAAMEALAVGKYCLLSDIDSHFEIQRLVPSLNIVARDVSKWILEIESIVNMTDEEREKIGKQNREYVKESLTMNKMQEKYTNIYKKINKNRG
jgi:glycosyltransferase involved in cell wall biosynthesis